MAMNPSNVEPEAEVPGRAACIRSAVEKEYELLLRSIALLVAKTERRLHWPQVMEVAWELLNEAVQEALKYARSFDPARSAAAWVRGIAARLLLSRRRKAARDQRCVPATVLG